MESSHRQPAHSEELTVLGKFKGELNSEFMMVYVAVDCAGNFWTNPSPSMNSRSGFSDEGWSRSSREQVQIFKNQLFFIPGSSANRNALNGALKANRSSSKRIQPKQKL